MGEQTGIMIWSKEFFLKYGYPSNYINFLSSEWIHLLIHLHTGLYIVTLSEDFYDEIWIEYIL